MVRALIALPQPSLYNPALLPSTFSLFFVPLLCFSSLFLRLFLTLPCFSWLLWASCTVCWPSLAQNMSTMMSASLPHRLHQSWNTFWKRIHLVFPICTGNFAFWKPFSKSRKLSPARSSSPSHVRNSATELRRSTQPTFCSFAQPSPNVVAQEQYYGQIGEVV